MYRDQIFNLIDKIEKSTDNNKEDLSELRKIIFIWTDYIDNLKEKNFLMLRHIKELQSDLESAELIIDDF